MRKRSLLSLSHPGAIPNEHRNLLNNWSKQAGCGGGAASVISDPPRELPNKMSASEGEGFMEKQM